MIHSQNLFVSVLNIVTRHFWFSIFQACGSAAQVRCGHVTCAGQWNKWKWCALPLGWSLWGHSPHYLPTPKWSGNHGSSWSIHQHLFLISRPSLPTQIRHVVWMRKETFIRLSQWDLRGYLLPQHNLACPEWHMFSHKPGICVRHSGSQY